MTFRSLYRFKPLFKKFLTVRENIQNRKKLLKFKKEKWKLLKIRYGKKLKFFKKYKAIDQSRYSVSKFARKGNSYKKRYRNTLQAVKSFKLFYGDFLKKQLKKKISVTLKNQKKNKNIELFVQFLKQFESRLDVTLVRSKFCSTIRLARQIIKHGKIKVNNVTVKSKNYGLKPGDFIKIRSVFKDQLDKICKDMAIEENLWPHPPKHLYINYKTFQIIFGTISQNDFSIFFSTNLKLEKVLLNYYKKQ